MKTSLKVSLIAVMAGALALVILIGASIGSAYTIPPDAALSDDLILIGNAKADNVNLTGDVKVVDINSMTVVNTIAESSAGSLVSNNHGVLIDGTGRYIWNSNHALAAGKARLVKYDLQAMSPVTTWDIASADVYAFSGGVCGIEWNNNDPSTGKIWTTSMSTGTGNGGLYEVDATTGPTGAFIDNTAGADIGATCGIAWNTSGGTAYASAMSAKKTSSLAWPGGPIGTTAVSTSALHMLDTAKTANYAYVAADTKIDIVDISVSPIAVVATVVPALSPTPAMHDTKVAHSEGFLYAHSRNGSPSTNGETGTLLVYDIGGVVGGTGTKLAPVLIGVTADEGSTGASCGTQLLSKAAYTGKPGLSLSKTGVGWGSYAEYLAGILTVNYSVGNSSSGTYAALQTSITGSSSNNGVTLNTTLPVSLGTIGTGSSKALQLKYNLPGGVGSFLTTTSATAKDLGGTSYTYP